MLSMRKLVEYQVELGYVDFVDRVLDPALEPTKYMREADRRGRTVVFKVRTSPLSAVSGVVNSREKLYHILGVSRDEEAYEKLVGSLTQRSSNFRVTSFSDFYERYGGDVLSLPALKFYERDGGLYITSSIVIAKTPDLDSYNASIHRLMVLSGDSLAIRLVPRHLYRIYELNKEQGRETPVAIVIGAHPVVELASSMSPPYGVFEFELVKALSGEDLEIAYTPKYSLPVPAYSSVVIEGRITLETVSEGPFVDILLLYDRVRQQPVVKVDSIYVSKDRDYFHVILPGGWEHMLLMGLPREAAIWDSVRRVVPCVRKVRLTPASGMWLHAVISICRESEGDGKTAIMAAFAAHPSLKHVVVVDEDIDPDRPEEVEWAIATRFQASRGLVLVHHARGSTLDPSSEDGLTDKVGIDATFPIKSRELFLRPRARE
jgi:UbiD family decarboxylase